MAGKKRRSFIFFLIGLFIPISFSFAGTVLSAHKYAWSDNVGYINFENILVGDSVLSGYAWSKNAGWIKFNPSTGGVFNDGNGNLSGYAWGENLGWINFSGVKISTSTGQFSGTATGTLVGTINFDCPNYCDVRTDWSPVFTCSSWTYSDWSSCSGGTQTRTVVSSSPLNCTGGSPVLTQSCNIVSSGGFFSAFPPVSNYINAVNDLLVINGTQSGTYTKDTDVGQIVLQVPANNVKNKTTFYIDPEVVNNINKILIVKETSLVNSSFYNVYAIDQDGNYVHNFSYPITISLPVPEILKGNPNLAVYWLNEVNMNWVLIPDVVFANNKATFQVNHLTKFAIFGLSPEISTATTSTPLISKVEPKPFLPIPNVSKTQLVDLLPEKESQNVEIIEKANRNVTSTMTPGEAPTKNPTITNISTTTSEKIKKQNNYFWIILIFVFFAFYIIFYKKKRKQSE